MPAGQEAVALLGAAKRVARLVGGEAGDLAGVAAGFDDPHWRSPMAFVVSGVARVNPHRQGQEDLIAGLPSRSFF